MRDVTAVIERHEYYLHVELHCFFYSGLFNINFIYDIQHIFFFVNVQAFRGPIFALNSCESKAKTRHPYPLTGTFNYLGFLMFYYEIVVFTDKSTK